MEAVGDSGKRDPMSGSRLVDVDAEWRVSTDELRLRLDDPGLTIVDVRPLAAYNGWNLLGAARGGHIPGAVAFPSTWLDRIEPAEVQKLLRVKDVTDAREIVLYGDLPDEVWAMRTRLVELGQERVRV